MSTGPNMATITAALERSLQNCSLSNTHNSHTQPDSPPGIGIGIGIGIGSSSSSSDEIHHLPPPNSDTALELNSHLSLPYHWEQCLDLKTGEIYYINWRNGMKAKEDPREYNEDYYSEEEEDEDDSCYDSEESSTESSTFNSTRDHKNHGVKEEEEEREEKGDQVLVVAGCKSCLMYFMVPKHLEDCPKCKNGQLLHFDRSDNDIIP